MSDVEILSFTTPPVYLLVCDVPTTADSSSLRRQMEPFGLVISCNIRSTRGLTHAFVEFAATRCLERARATLGKTLVVDGKACRVVKFDSRRRAPLPLATSITIANHFLGNARWFSEVAYIKPVSVTFVDSLYRLTYEAAVILRFRHQLVAFGEFTDENLMILGCGRACGCAASAELAAKTAAKVCVTNATNNAFRKIQIVLLSSGDVNETPRVAVASNEFVNEIDDVDDGVFDSDDEDEINE